MLPGKSLTPADVLEILRRRVWWIVIPPVLTFFAALVASSKVPNLYQSDMLIAIDAQRVPDAFVRTTVTGGTDARLDQVSVQVLSRTNLEKMIAELNLYPRERETMPIGDVAGLMRSNLVIQLERPRPAARGQEQSSAFHVRFSYEDPATAADVAQRIGLLFVEQNSQDRRGRAQSTNAFLEVQLDEARQKLVAQEKKLEAFRGRHGKELPTQMQSNMQAISTTQLQVQAVVESIARDKDRKLMLERLYREAVNEPPPPPVASAQPSSPGGIPTGGSARERLAAAKTNLASLELRYKSGHPDITRAKRLVGDLEVEAAAEDEAAKAAAATSTPVPAAVTGDPARRERLRQMAAEIESLDRQTAFKESEERRMRAEITQYQQRIEAVPGLESEWASLTRDYDTEQTEYRELLAKAGAAKLAVDLEQEQIGENFRIVDAANIPVHPLPSPRRLINAGGLMLGLLCGLALVAFWELRDATFRTEPDVIELLALPVLATVPYVPSSAEVARQRHQMMWASALSAVVVVAMGYTTWSLKLWNSLL